MANLKKLNQFLVFDHQSFFEGKKLVLCSIKWDAHNSLVKGELVIVEDATTDNEYGKITFKLSDSKEDDVKKYELKKAYKISGIEKATVYGDYRDNLSITCKALVRVDNLNQNSAQNVPPVSNFLKK